MEVNLFHIFNELLKLESKVRFNKMKDPRKILHKCFCKLTGDKVPGLQRDWLALIPLTHYLTTHDVTRSKGLVNGCFIVCKHTIQSGLLE